MRDITLHDEYFDNSSMIISFWPRFRATASIDYPDWLKPRVDSRARRETYRPTRSRIPLRGRQFARPRRRRESDFNDCDCYRTPPPWSGFCNTLASFLKVQQRMNRKLRNQSILGIQKWNVGNGLKCISTKIRIQLSEMEPFLRGK